MVMPLHASNKCWEAGSELLLKASVGDWIGKASVSQYKRHEFEPQPESFVFCQYKIISPWNKKGKLIKRSMNLRSFISL